jgi:2-phosphosulfolactate phosphatase
MKLTTSLLAGSDTCTVSSDLAVVIDVLRATSVMVTAFHHGASRILACREVDEARQLAAAVLPRPLLCGERGCQRIDGFDLGNSTAEYTPDRVRSRTLILTTTNGTRAIASVNHIPRVVAASFLNLSAVVGRLSKSERVHFVCAGTDGRITLEDVLLAGALIEQSVKHYGADLDDDDSMLAQQLWRSWFVGTHRSDALPDVPSLSAKLAMGRGGQNLLRLGFEEDLARCAMIDTTNVVPEKEFGTEIGGAIGFRCQRS